MYETVRTSPYRPAGRHRLPFAGNVAMECPLGLEIHIFKSRQDKSMANIADYRNNRLLAAMSSAESQRLLPHLEPVDMPFGKVLSQPGSASAYVYFPTTLSASLLVDLEDGASAEIAAIGHEGMVGISYFLGGVSTLSRAVVTRAGTGFRLQTELLLEQFNRNGPLMHLLLRYTQALMAQMAQNAVCNRRHSVTEHLCRWLLDAQDRGLSEDIEITQEHLATILGVRRESVTDAAGDLQHAGMIRYRRGHVTLLDRGGLESRSCECYAVVKHEYDRLLPAMAAPLNLSAVPTVGDSVGRLPPCTATPPALRSHRDVLRPRDPRSASAVGATARIHSA